MQKLDAVDAAVCTDIALKCLTAHVIIASVASAVSLVLVVSAHAHYTSVSLTVFDIARSHICRCAEFVSCIIIPAFSVRQHT